MVRQQFDNGPLQSLVMFNSSVLLVRVLHRVLISFIGGNLRRQLFGNNLSNFIDILPINVSKRFVEGLEDVAE